MNNPGRPLSPHLSVYRWPITMVLSILHRVTGVALSLGLLLYAVWLMSTAGSAGSFARFSELMASPLGRIVLIAFSAAFFLHLANGIRHLVWDSGFGFERSQANFSGWLVIALTIVLTLVFWWLL